MMDLHKKATELEGQRVVLSSISGKTYRGYIIALTTAIDNETDGEAMWSLDLEADHIYEFFEDEITSIELDETKY